jgi:hypothetical protein
VVHLRAVVLEQRPRRRIDPLRSPMRKHAKRPA